MPEVNQLDLNDFLYLGGSVEELTHFTQNTVYPMKNRLTKW